jgi:hypothetical protein
MWVDTHAVKAGNSTLTALADSGVSLDAAGMGAATRLSDSYLAGVRFETVTGAQYLDGLVALARLDVRLEQAHFLLYLIGNSLQDSRAWLGAASAEPVRRAVQLLIQTGLADLRPTRTKLREMLRDPTPAWGPRLRARVLGFVSFDGPEGVALERLREARRLDPRSPWLLGVLAERQLEAGRSRQALESVDASLVLHYAEALDTRVGTRWETAWLEAKGVQALAHLEKYKEAGARLDALLRSPTSPAALVNLRRRGVINVLERQLGRTFERAKPLGWRTD